MTQQQRVREFSRTAVALAVFAAFASAQAQDKKEEEKKNPVETEITLEGGAAYVSGDPADRGFWGQYNGMRFKDAYGIANFGYSRRDTSTGTLLDVYGSNLGLQTREVGVFWTRQGDWRLNANYGELWRVNPYTVNTGVSGSETAPRANYLTGGPGSGGDIYPNTKRRAIELGGSKAFGGAWMLEGSVNSENKNGSELFGVGNQCPGTTSAGCTFTPGVTSGFGILYMPKPVDYNHTQAEARLNYAGSALQLSGGYYGSFFSNSNGSMTPGVPGILNNAVGQPLPAGPGVPAYIGQPVALAPDNTFHQVDLTGNYVFSPMVRSNFKLSYGRTTQDQEFGEMGLAAGAPAGVSSLSGQVNHTLAQVRVIANPIAKLSLMGEYRYANQEDDTSIVPYGQVGSVQYTNYRVHREVNNGRLEATYRFPWSVQGTAGWNFESIDRGSFTPTASYSGVSALREETDESTWFLEVRRNMTETVSGLLRYSFSKRDGSDWLAPAAGGVGLVGVSDPAQLGSNAIYMPTLADRDRSKLRLLLTWSATDALTVQFAADVGRDEYELPTRYAVQESSFDLYTVDVNYALSDAWNLNGYVSSGKQKLHQARPGGYVLAFDDKSLNAGIGFNGKATEKLKLGGMLSFVNNTDSYSQGLDVNPSPGNAQLLAVTGGLPDVVYRRTELRIFGNYDLSARSAVRFDAAYQRLTYEDWGYQYGGTPFLYSDNTTVFLQPDQNVGYLGVSYIYSWK